MHFDAVLEFVVEYPLSWQKDRRLPFGSSDGEVRWTNQEYPDVLLKIQSAVAENQTTDNDETFDRVTADYPGIEFSKVEEIDILETKGTLVEGETRRLHVQTYLLYINNRSYMISLEKPIDSQDDFQAVMDKVVHSFKAIPKTE